VNITRKLTVAISLIYVLTCPINVFAANDVGDGISKVVNKTGKVINDAGITTQIKGLLALESDIKSFNISVTTKSRVVYLDGNVDTGLQADKVVELAQSVSGVKDVNNSKLKIKDSKNYTKDSFITAKVKGTIMQLSSDDKINSKNDLHVETTNGAVHIFGTVANNDDVSVLKDTVSKVDGVKSVNTNIDTK
jgi:hyperosmotically inducible protein